MPKYVDKVVDALLADKEFYPELSPEKKKSRAFAIAWKQYKNKSKGKKSKALSVDDLVKLADQLDAQGRFLEAQEVEKELQRFAQGKPYTEGNWWNEFSKEQQELQDKEKKSSTPVRGWNSAMLEDIKKRKQQKEVPNTENSFWMDPSKPLRDYVEKKATWGSGDWTPKNPKRRPRIRRQRPGKPQTATTPMASVEKPQENFINAMKSAINAGARIVKDKKFYQTVIDALYSYAFRQVPSITELPSVFDAKKMVKKLATDKAEEIFGTYKMEDNAEFQAKLNALRQAVLALKTPSTPKPEPTPTPGPTPDPKIKSWLDSLASTLASYEIGKAKKFLLNFEEITYSSNIEEWLSNQNATENLTAEDYKQAMNEIVDGGYSPDDILEIARIHSIPITGDPQPNPAPKPEVKMSSMIYPQFKRGAEKPSF